MSREQSINTLNSFLRGEIAAVETYRHALARLQETANEAELRACLASHERRVAALSHQIRELGGHPAERSGPWGAFARLFEAGAAALGDEAAIAVLEEGEDHGLKLYLDDVCKLDRESRKHIEREVLPEQVRTHDSLSDLKLTLHGD
jgi:demethoxyubiquinone hydroxylase (CLK1/Coq7/Cat5 family)